MDEPDNEDTWQAIIVSASGNYRIVADIRSNRLGFDVVYLSQEDAEVMLESMGYREMEISNIRARLLEAVQIREDENNLRLAIMSAWDIERSRFNRQHIGTGLFLLSSVLFTAGLLLLIFVDLKAGMVLIGTSVLLLIAGAQFTLRK